MNQGRCLRIRRVICCNCHCFSSALLRRLSDGWRALPPSLSPLSRSLCLAVGSITAIVTEKFIFPGPGSRFLCHTVAPIGRIVAFGLENEPVRTPHERSVSFLSNLRAEAGWHATCYVLQETIRSSGPNMARLPRTAIETGIHGSPVQYSFMYSRTWSQSRGINSATRVIKKRFLFHLYVSFRCGDLRVYRRHCVRVCLVHSVRIHLKQKL